MAWWLGAVFCSVCSAASPEAEWRKLKDEQGRDS